MVIIKKSIFIFLVSLGVFQLNGMEDPNKIPSLKHNCFCVLLSNTHLPTKEIPEEIVSEFILFILEQIDNQLVEVKSCNVDCCSGFILCDESSDDINYIKNLLSSDRSLHIITSDPNFLNPIIEKIESITDKIHCYGNDSCFLSLKRLITSQHIKKNVYNFKKLMDLYGYMQGLSSENGISKNRKSLEKLEKEITKKSSQCKFWQPTIKAFIIVPCIKILGFVYQDYRRPLVSFRNIAQTLSISGLIFSYYGITVYFDFDALPILPILPKVLSLPYEKNKLYRQLLNTEIVIYSSFVCGYFMYKYCKRYIESSFDTFFESVLKRDSNITKLKTISKEIGMYDGFDDKKKFLAKNPLVRYYLYIFSPIFHPEKSLSRICCTNSFIKMFK